MVYEGVALKRTTKVPPRFLVGAFIVSCLSCDPRTGTVIFYDWDNGTVDVNVEIRGDGITGSWHLVKVFCPSNSVGYFIYLGRDDCPSNDDIQMTIYGQMSPGEDVLNVWSVWYFLADECVLDPDGVDFHEAGWADESGRMRRDVNDHRWKVTFDEVTIGISGDQPPPGNPAIHVITLDGEFTAPAL
jgi:hypothetical protein